MKCFHFALSLAQLDRRGETFANRLSIYLAGQAKVRAVTRLAWLMTATIGFSTTAFDRSNGAATEIAQLKNSRQDVGAVLFKGVQRVRQRGPPVLTYIYVRIISPKKENCQILP